MRAALPMARRCSRYEEPVAALSFTPLAFGWDAAAAGLSRQPPCRSALCGGSCGEGFETPALLHGVPHAFPAITVTVEVVVSEHYPGPR